MSDEIKPPKPSEILEVALKGSAAVVGVLYTTGLIVASLRLAQLGVVSTEFVKPLYVLTGAWAWFPIAIAFVIWSQYRASLKRSHELKRRGKVRAALTAVLVAALLASLVFNLPKHVNQYLHGMGFGELFPFSVLLSTFAAFVLGFWIKLSITTAKTMADALSGAVISLFLGISYLLTFTFLVYVSIPAQLGGGGARTFALVIGNAEIRQAITGKVEANPIITPVFAETAGNYILPAPKVRLKEFSLNQVFEDSFVIVPKQAVSVATVIGSAPVSAVNNGSLRDKMNSFASPSAAPKQ
jgi:hypothetical protein